MAVPCFRTSPSCKAPKLKIPQAKGLAILTVAKVGIVVTYNVSLGLAVARKADRLSSVPSATSIWYGLGAQGK